MATTIISTRPPGIISRLRELWQFRGLLLTFAYRDYRSRYAQTAVGFGWALLQPLLSMVVLFVLFQRVLQTDTQGIPFFPYALSGLVFWNYFHNVVSQSSASLINAQQMLQKIYFPRLILPLSKGLVGLIEALVAFVIFSIFASANGVWQPASLLLFWPALLLSMLAALGIGLWISALSIRFRDLQQVVPLGLQLLFFLTPVAYAPAMLENFLGAENMIWAYLNPLSGIIELFRAGALGLALSGNWPLSLLATLVLFSSGAWFFFRTERQLADLI